MSEPTVLTEVADNGVGTIRLNRPARNNAYDGEMILALIDAVQTFAAADAVRVVVVRGNGRHFQAGADLDHHPTYLPAETRQAFRPFGMLFRQRAARNRAHSQ